MRLSKRATNISTNECIESHLRSLLPIDNLDRYDSSANKP